MEGVVVGTRWMRTRSRYWGIEEQMGRHDESEWDMVGMPMTRKNFGSGLGGFSFSFSFLGAVVWRVSTASVHQPKVFGEDGTSIGGQRPRRQTPYLAVPSLAISQRAGARRLLEWEAVMFYYRCRILGTFFIGFIDILGCCSALGIVDLPCSGSSCFDDVSSVSLTLVPKQGAT